MTQSLSPRITPATISDVIDIEGNAGWCSRVRAAAKKAGQAIRAGSDLSIEGKSLIDNLWRPIQLPGGSSQFATAKDRDDALKLILHP